MTIDASNLPQIAYSGKPINIKGNVAGVPSDKKKMNATPNISQPSNIGSGGIGEVLPNNNGAFSSTLPKSFTTDFIVIVTDVNVKKKILSGKYGSDTFRYGRTPETTTTILYPQNFSTSQAFLKKLIDGVKISELLSMIESKALIVKIIEGVILNDTTTQQLIPPPVDYSVMIVDGTIAGDIVFVPPIIQGQLSSSGNNSFGVAGKGSSGSTTGIIDAIDSGVSLVSDCVEIYGQYHLMFAKRSDGSWWGAGLNTSYQLGYNPGVPNNTNQFSFVLIDGTTNVKKMSAGHLFSAKIHNDGSLYTVGDNSNGQLGLGDNSPRTTWTLVDGVNFYTDIALSDWTLYALRSDGTLWTSGAGTLGQLGQGSTANSNVLIQVPGSWKKICPAVEGVSAIATDGTLWAWGANSGAYFQRLSGSGVDFLSPQQISSMTNWKDSALSEVSFVAITNSGDRWSMGQPTNAGSGGTVGYQPFANYDSINGYSWSGQWLSISSNRTSTYGRLFNGQMIAYGQNIGGTITPGLPFGTSVVPLIISPPSISTGKTSWAQPLSSFTDYHIINI